MSTVSQQLCVNQEVIYNYVKTYRQKGLDGLVNLEKPGKESKLTEEQMMALEYFIEECKKKKIKCTTHEQVTWLKQKFNIEIGPKWLYKRLLIRRQNRFDKIAMIFFWITLVLNELTLRPGYKRLAVSTLHVFQVLPLVR